MHITYTFYIYSCRLYQISACLIDQEEQVLHTYGDLRVRIMTYYCHVKSIHYHILTTHIHTPYIYVYIRLYTMYIRLQVSNGLYCYNQTDKVDRTITLTSSAAKGGDEVSGVYT